MLWRWKSDEEEISRLQRCMQKFRDMQGAGVSEVVEMLEWAQQWA